MNIRHAMVIATIFLALPAVAADEEGWIGLEASAVSSGEPSNPVLELLLIELIEPGSPAEGSRIEPGDSIVGIQGQKISGMDGRSLQLLLRKSPGETLELTLVTQTGEQYNVVLVAGRRPIEQ